MKKSKLNAEIELEQKLKSYKKVVYTVLFKSVRLKNVINI